jgi:hypothetical protein
MHDLFNPAGLHVLEDRDGAVAYGWIAHRVFYGRFVGSLSAELGTSFVQRLSRLVSEVPALAYFADASALDQYDLVARTRFQRLVLAERRKFVSMTILAWAGGVGPSVRNFSALLVGAIDLLTDPAEFDRALVNVAPRPAQGPLPVEPVWQVVLGGERLGRANR